MSFLRKILFKKILQHKPNTKLQSSWIKSLLSNNNRQLHLLHKITSQNISLGKVLLCHPFRAEAKDFYLESGHAKMYLDMGYDVFIFDFNGFGESPFIDYLFEKDILCIIEYIKKYHPDDKLIVHGISFGAAQLIRTLVTDNHGIDKAIIENSLTKYQYYFKNRKPMVFALLQLITPFFMKMTFEHNYVEKIARLLDITKVMFIYGKQDELTTVAMGRELAANCNVDHDFVLFNCAHMEAIETDFEDYKKLIIDYIDS